MIHLEVVYVVSKFANTAYYGSKHPTQESAAKERDKYGAEWYIWKITVEKVDG